MRKLLKSKKALTPVVAAVAVIAAMIAVAIIAALLMSTIAINSMSAKELSSELSFSLGDSSSGRMMVHVTNPQNNDVTVAVIKVNDETANIWSSGTSNTVAPDASETFTITHEVVTGQEYCVTMYNNDGTLIASCTKTA